MAHDSHHAPGLPEIHDEAADTPMWLPMLGLGLFVLLSLFLIVRAAVNDAAEELGGDEAVVVEAAEAAPAH
ncbi:MAG: hypothetical protein H6721_09600 [Sandaracinus sp.]|nr:hypothetical protein [Sandaracinus sp.]MCB9620627.1 hypothetical protein [Sandaracinus sp.]MCB9632368.1 hypothetical protein [Sandaracinus sp.]